MPEQLTFFLIAGEPSGDARGAELVLSLKEINPNLRFEGLGGPKMEAAGVRLLYDLTRISALGLGDVLRQYFQIRKIFYDALSHARNTKPACVILIDYPGFNLRFAKKIARAIPVFYYVSPQIWAWGARRIRTIKRVVDRMIVLFPFEESLYEEAGIPVTWVGHPIAETAAPKKTKEELLREFDLPQNQKVIAILPGSRASEVKRILPAVLKTAFLISKRIKNASFLISESPNVPAAIYDSIVQRANLPFPISKIRARMHDILNVSDFALVTSGTATLETAMFLVPFILLYKTAWSTYLIGKQLIRVPFLGIVNILAGKKVVSEYIQNDLRPDAMADEVCRILEDKTRSRAIIRELEEIKSKLGPPGAGDRAAATVLKHLEKL